MVLRKVKGILKKGAYAGLAAVILATSVTAGGSVCPGQRRTGGNSRNSRGDRANRIRE